MSDFFDDVGPVKPPDSVQSLTNSERVESLKMLLVGRATGGTPPEGRFIELRRAVLADGHPDDLVPSFLRTCRSLQEFWGFIKPQFKSYAERREFLRAEFDPLLSHVEQSELRPAVITAAAALTRFSESGVRDSWQKMLARLTEGPDGAITAARTMAETVCKHILDERGESYGRSPELPALYSQVAKALNLAPEQHKEQVFKQILGSCVQVANGLASLRNEFGDAHGTGRRAVRASPRHAELAVNLAGSLAAFLIATHLERADASSG